MCVVFDGDAHAPLLLCRRSNFIFVEDGGCTNESRWSVVSVFRALARVCVCVFVPAGKNALDRQPRRCVDERILVIELIRYLLLQLRTSARAICAE